MEIQAHVITRDLLAKRNYMRAGTALAILIVAKIMIKPPILNNIRQEAIEPCGKAM